MSLEAAEVESENCKPKLALMYLSIYTKTSEAYQQTTSRQYVCDLKEYAPFISNQLANERAKGSDKMDPYIRREEQYLRGLSQVIEGTCKMLKRCCSRDLSWETRDLFLFS